MVKWIIRVCLEMAQQLRAVTILAGNSGSVPNIYMVAHKHLLLHLKGNLVPKSDL